MPILNPNDPLVKRLGLAEPKWGVALPDPAEAAATFTDIGRELAQEAFARTQLGNFADGFQVMSGGIMQRVGAPNGDALFGNNLYNGLVSYLNIDDPSLELLTDIGKVAINDILDEVIDEIQKIIADLLMRVLEPIFSMISTIPIYGWVIEAVWDMAIGIAKIVNLIKKSNAPDPELEYEAAAFSPSTDVITASAMSRVISFKEDWTGIFLPPGVGEGDVPGVTFTKSKIHYGGYRVRAAGSHCESWDTCWYGFIPGNNTMDLGFEIGNFNRSLGQLFPTTRNFGISVWDQVNAKGPAMFAVDAVRSWNLWEAHLGELRTYLYKSDIPKSKEFVDILGKQLFAWKGWDAGVDAYRAFKKDGDYEKYYKGLGVSHLSIAAKVNGVRPSTPARAMYTLYGRQMAYLNTTLCAYVKPKYGAFTGNTTIQPETKALIDRMEKNRKLLLEHPALCELDVSSIADHTFKSEVEYRLWDPNRCKPSKGRLTAPDMGKVDPPKVNPIPATVSMMPTKEDVKEHVRRGGVVTPFLLITAAVGSFWYAKRKGIIK